MLSCLRVALHCAGSSCEGIHSAAQATATATTAEKDSIIHGPGDKAIDAIQQRKQRARARETQNTDTQRHTQRHKENGPLSPKPPNCRLTFSNPNRSKISLLRPYFFSWPAASVIWPEDPSTRRHSTESLWYVPCPRLALAPPISSLLFYWVLRTPYCSATRVAVAGFWLVLVLVLVLPEPARRNKPQPSNLACRRQGGTKQMGGPEKAVPWLLQRPP